mgnify:CR=1 FL=1
MYQRDFTDLSFFLHRLSVYSDLCGPEIFLVRKNGTTCAGHSEENHHFPGRLHLRDLSAPYADQRIFFRPVEATLVDGVYDSDPNKNPDAKRYDLLSFSEVLNKKLAVMDMTAASMCRDNKTPILVFSISDPDNIFRAVNGEQIGTLVKEA